MFDKELTSEQKKQKICYILPEDSSAMKVITVALEREICQFILIGNQTKITTLINQTNSKLISNCEIIDAIDYKDAIKIAVEKINTFKAHAIMKGNLTTSEILRELFKKEYNFRTDYRVSILSVFKMKNYHKLLFLTDPAINIKPDVDLKAELILNSIEYIKKFGIEKPKVGILCATEVVNEKMQATLDAVELTKRFSGSNDVEVYGPLAFDNAISKKAAITKNITSSVAGNVDLLVCDSIEQANVLYKALTYMADAKCAGMVIGLKVPIIATSRTDAIETKIDSIILSL